MSKPSRRPNREELKTERKERKQAQKALGSRLAEEGLPRKSHATITNGKCRYQSLEEESLSRNEATWEQLKVLRAELPRLLKRFAAIPDPRNPRKTKHKLSVLLLFGILSFVLQMASSREATREMSRPMFWENLKSFFPELEEVPHHDTLKRLLAALDISELENLHLELVRRWIKKKKFRRYLVDNCYPIAIDGTQKMCRDELWAEECLQRTFNRGESTEQSQYYVYVLQASLAFSGGINIPLLSEFLTYAGDGTDHSKQDCELKAFHRLSQRLKEAFPALRIMVLLDGLYAKGPVLHRCHQYHWQYMIVLKDGSLPTVMREFEALAELEPKHRHNMTWGGRNQRFKWANDIEYEYGQDRKKRVILHVVECREQWREIEKRSSTEIENKSRHVWISSESLNKWNLHERCNLGGRSRWVIETGFLVEKHHGYQYEHCFSYDWNAMKGYHCLMQLGHMFNVMAQYSGELARIIKDTGVRGLIRFVRESMASPWIDAEWIKEKLAAPFRLRLT
jgi:DDE_Tnp_1-associated